MIFPELDLFLFDLAGTTVRDPGLVLGAFRRVVERHALAVSDSWLKQHMGLHKEQVFAELLAGCDSPLDPALLAGEFAEAVAEALRAQPPDPTPGTEDLLGLLRERGTKVGFVTGFTGKTARLIVSQTGWAADVVVGSDEVAAGRPAPDLVLEAMRRLGLTDSSRVALAGDTPSDLGLGINAGCALVVGVGCGTHTLEELRPHADHPGVVLVPDLGEIARMIRAAV